MIGLIVLLTGLVAFCTLLYFSAVYAVPFAVGLWIAFGAMHMGVGEIGGFAIGAVVGVLLFFSGKVILQTTRSAVVRWLVVIAFGIPAGFAGFSAVQQIWPLLLPATTWQYVASIVAATATASAAIARLASRQHANVQFSR